jgi:hypothetical protein
MRTGLWCGVTRYHTVDPTLHRIYLSPQLPSYPNSQCNINNKNMYFWYLVKSHSKDKQVYLRILVDNPPSHIRRNGITHYQLYYQLRVLLLVPSSFGIFVALHQQKIFPSGRNGSVRVDALRQSRQRHPGGGLLRARPQYHASRCISPSDRCFTVSSCSVGLLF